MNPQILSDVAMVVIVVGGLVGSAWYGRRAVSAEVATLAKEVNGEVAARAAEVGLIVASQAESLRKRVDDLERELHAAHARPEKPAQHALASTARRLLGRHPTDDS